MARSALIVVDEVGYTPANLFLPVVSGHYERASGFVTSNKAFGRRGEVFRNDNVAAVIDRLAPTLK
ncbi:ATP-binding protein [Streptomyces flaveolus]|uniref:ATP-binding protein n=1 Tax=Streptomyces flaveolus TaxID=67297 RepID=A0ABV1VJE2_9ACTN